MDFSAARIVVEVGDGVAARLDRRRGAHALHVRPHASAGLPDGERSTVADHAADLPEAASAVHRAPFHEVADDVRCVSGRCDRGGRVAEGQDVRIRRHAAEVFDGAERHRVARGAARDGGGRPRGLESRTPDVRKQRTTGDVHERGVALGGVSRRRGVRQRGERRATGAAAGAFPRPEKGAQRLVCRERGGIGDTRARPVDDLRHHVGGGRQPIAGCFEQRVL